MRRSISNEDNHLTRVLPPFHIESLDHSSSNSFRAVATSGGIQAREVLVHLADIRGEPKVPDDVCVILWGMVPEGHQADSKVLKRL